MIALMNFREDGITPYMLFFKDGLVEEKCVSKAKQSKKLIVLCSYYYFFLVVGLIFGVSASTVFIEVI